MLHLPKGFVNIWTNTWLGLRGTLIDRLSRMLFCSAAKRNGKCVLNTAGSVGRDFRFLILADLSQLYCYADVNVLQHEKKKKKKVLCGWQILLSHLNVQLVKKTHYINYIASLMVILDIVIIHTVLYGSLWSWIRIFVMQMGLAYSHPCNSSCRWMRKKDSRVLIKNVTFLC